MDIMKTAYHWAVAHQEIFVVLIPAAFIGAGIGQAVAWWSRGRRWSIPPLVAVVM